MVNLMMHAFLNGTLIFLSALAGNYMPLRLHTFEQLLFLKKAFCSVELSFFIIIIMGRPYSHSLCSTLSQK